ncbi:MAG: acyl-CoA dehydratase activase-related protein, partial [Spirochaetales bacterium]
VSAATIGGFIGSSIGSVVCFQGATAKNEALVAAFETELGRPIAVSRYCHVTGALGAALTCIDEGITESSFRGIDLYKSDIPVRSERCSLCTNHCRLRIAKVGEEEVAFGFLCGRDYETASFVSANKAGFDLAAARRKIERAVARPKRGEPIVAELDPDESRFFVQVGRRADDIKNAFVGFVESTSDRVGRAVTQQQSRSHSLRPIEPTAPRRVPTLGVPAGLHLAEEHHYFQRVFAELGIPTRSSAGAEDVVAVGKKLEGAEFCSPVAAFHGHVEKMLETADLVFVPVVLERDDTGERRRSYCYYTQFTSSMLTGVVPPEERNRLVSPVLYGVGIDPAAELYQALTSHYAITLPQVRLAMNRARRALADSREQLKALFAENRRAPTDGEIDVVILGRPYTAMDPGMNKSIPQIFERAGVRAFFQDMLPDSLPTEETGLLLQSVHWRYAAEILLAADVASRTPGLYPVFVTSFKCAPDSFCQDAFKRIMESRDKPYLILQLDEHDSNVGYETRIEAAIRAFRNHHAMIAAGPLATREEVRAAGEGTKSDGPIMPKLERVVRGRTLLLPNWDTITIPLIAANLRAHGIDAVALTETPQSIQQSMRLNSGQCIPVSALAQEAMDYVRESGRSAEEFVLWMIQGDWACGIPLYPSFIKSLFHQEGLGEIGVFVGEITFTDIAPAATIGAYFAYQFGGWLRALSCRIRPYEQNEGQTNAVLERAHKRLLRVIENKGNRLRWLRETVDAFTAIPTYGQQKPKVAIFGDLYVRDNDVMNQGLIETIEAAGGEAITTPYSDYVKLIAGTTFERMRSKGLYGNLAKFRVIVGLIDRLEKRYHREVEDILGPPLPWRIPGQRRDLAKFGMVIEQSGESFDNALKILHLISRHDDIALFVQASPAFCCPSLVTEALSGAIEAATGVPIVTVTYDGTGADKNASIIPYIKFPRVTASA